MATPQDLVRFLGDGKGQAQHADTLGPMLNLPPGRTQEDTRKLVREAITLQFPNW